jgi:hypothetical protein
MKIAFTLTEDDLFEAIRARWRKEQRRKAGRALVLFVIFQLVVVLLGIGTIQRGNIFGGVVVITLFPVSFLLLLWFQSRKRRSFAKKQFSSNPSMQSPSEIVSNEEGISGKDSLTGWVHRWEAFVSYLESDNLLLLFVSDVSSHILPKRAFADEAELQAFRELLASRIGAVYPKMRQKA